MGRKRILLSVLALFPFWLPLVPAHSSPLIEAGTATIELSRNIVRTIRMIRGAPRIFGSALQNGEVYLHSQEFTLGIHDISWVTSFGSSAKWGHGLPEIEKLSLAAVRLMDLEKAHSPSALRSLYRAINVGWEEFLRSPQKIAELELWLSEAQLPPKAPGVGRVSLKKPWLIGARNRSQTVSEPQVEFLKNSPFEGKATPQGRALLEEILRSEDRLARRNLLVRMDRVSLVALDESLFSTQYRLSNGSFSIPVFLPDWQIKTELSEIGMQADGFLVRALERTRVWLENNQFCIPKGKSLEPTSRARQELGEDAVKSIEDLLARTGDYLKRSDELRPKLREDVAARMAFDREALSVEPLPAIEGEPSITMLDRADFLARRLTEFLEKL